TPHRLGIGGVRRAEIDEQHSHRAAGDLRMAGGPVADARARKGDFVHRGILEHVPMTSSHPRTSSPGLSCRFRVPDRRVRLPGKMLYCPCCSFGGKCQMSPVAIPMAIAAAVLFVAAPAAAQAELPSEWLLCSNEGKDYSPDIVVDGCSAVIRSGNRMP